MKLPPQELPQPRQCQPHSLPPVWVEEFRRRPAAAGSWSPPQEPAQMEVRLQAQSRGWAEAQCCWSEQGWWAPGLALVTRSWALGLVLRCLLAWCWFLQTEGQSAGFHHENLRSEEQCVESVVKLVSVLRICNQKGSVGSVVKLATAGLHPESLKSEGQCWICGEIGRNQFMSWDSENQAAVCCVWC